MPTINENLLPATTGLAIGNANQQWIAYLSNAFAGTVQSLTANPALTGIIRLASADTIAWRNNTNSADVTLSKTGAAVTTTPADTLVFSGGGFEGPFISHISGPAGNGELRLATSDAINFRNNAGNGDVAGLAHNSDDTVTVGGAGGIKQALILSATANPAASGIVRLANADQINWRNAGGSADEGISNAIAGGLQLNGANPNIRLGGATASFPMIKRNAAAIEVRLADDSAQGNLILANIPNYNNMVTVGNGIPAIYGGIDSTGLSTAVGTTNIVTVGATGATQYRFTWNAKVTTVDATSSTLGPMSVTYTDLDSTTHTITCGALILAGTLATTSTANTTAATLLGLPILLNCKPSTVIQYAFGYASNVAGTMNYNLHIRIEGM